MTAKTISIFKAQPAVKGDEIQSVTIDISRFLVCDQKTLDDLRVEYSNEGKLLCDTLLHVLPGGTFDALLAEMLEAKRSLFVVSHSAVGDSGLQ